MFWGRGRSPESGGALTTRGQRAAPSAIEEAVPEDRMGGMVGMRTVATCLFLFPKHRLLQAGVAACARSVDELVEHEATLFPTGGYSR